MTERNRAEAASELSIRHNNILQIRQKVQEILQTNEEQLDRLTVWTNMGDQYSLKDLIAIAAEEVKIKRSHLLTLGRLTLQTMDFLEEELTEKMESLNSNITIVEALKLSLEDRDARLLDWNTQIARLSDRVHELQYQLEMEQRKRPPAQSDQQQESFADVPSEIVYLRCKLQNTLSALNQKQTQLQQRQTLNSHLLKMLEEESEKRITTHHHLKLVQQNYRLLALQNVQLKGEIDLLRIELAEYRCTSVLGGPVRQEEELLAGSGVGEIPTLNLEALQHEYELVEPQQQQESSTERIQHKKKTGTNTPDRQLDIVHTDRNAVAKNKHNREPPTIKVEASNNLSPPRRAEPMARSKSTEALGVEFLEEASPGASVFASLRNWVVGSRLRRKRSNKRYE